MADEEFAQRVVVEAADGEGVGLQQAQGTAAGDHGRAPAHAGQERTDLGRGLGVVEDDQDAASDEAVVVEAAACVLLRRHLAGAHAERGQQASEGGGGIGRVEAGGAAGAEREMQDAAGVLAAHLLGELHRERGLADAAHAVEREDRSAAAVVGGALEHGP